MSNCHRNGHWVTQVPFGNNRGLISPAGGCTEADPTFQPPLIIASMEDTCPTVVVFFQGCSYFWLIKSGTEAWPCPYGWDNCMGKHSPQSFLEHLQAPQPTLLRVWLFSLPLCQEMGILGTPSNIRCYYLSLPCNLLPRESSLCQSCQETRYKDGEFIHFVLH